MYVFIKGGVLMRGHNVCFIKGGSNKSRLIETGLMRGKKVCFHLGGSNVGSQCILFL